MKKTTTKKSSIKKPATKKISSLKKKLANSTRPVMKVDKDGTKIWKLNNKYHREDGPAVEWDNGDKEWYRHDKLHREDGPAVEWGNRYKEWWLNGKLHRKDGPALEFSDGTKYWYLEGIEYSQADWMKKVKAMKKKSTSKLSNKKVANHIQPVMEVDANGSKYWRMNDRLHREDGPAIEAYNGDKEWWLDGERHRDDGPAIEWADGSKEWWIHDLLHREDGPAVEFASGDKQWFLEDKEYSENDWKKKVAEMKNKTSSQPSIKKADNNEQSELISALQNSLAHYRHQSEELAKTLSVYKEHLHCYKTLHTQAIEVIAELRSQIEAYRERDRTKIDTSLSRS